MDAMQLAAFAASIASLVLAVVAIVLSIVFYQMSSKLSESAKEASKDIGASVSKLEKLFDRLYADTFSMMKDTVSDMRKHAWGESISEAPNILEEAKNQAEEKIESLRIQTEKQVSEVLKGQKSADEKIDKIKGLVDKAIDGSRKVEHEVREETIRRYIIDLIHNMRRPGYRVRAIVIVDRVANKFPGHNILEELDSMKEDELVDWEGENLEPDSEIVLGKKAL